MVMVTLTTGITFLVYTYMQAGCEEFHYGGPRVRRPPMKRSAITKKFEKHRCKHYQTSPNSFTQHALYLLTGIVTCWQDDIIISKP
jgi:hypothetical protein